MSSKVAILGPEYSYTETAFKRFLPSCESVLYSSITKVIEALDSGEIELGFVPLENILNGLVGETLDCLLKHSKNLEIIDSTQLEIKHFIGSLSANLELKNITKIYSHPQALEQSREFILDNCPHAVLINCSSTSEAALKLLESAEENSAAIASQDALEVRKIKILSNTTTAHNATRFILIKRIDSNFPSPRSNLDSADLITSILIHPGSDRKGLLLEMLSIISGRFSANLSAIHSRPDGLGGFVFYLELSLNNKNERLEDLLSALIEYCKKETGGRAHISVLGTYFRDPFFTSQINTVGIIGGEGAMGKWFRSFYQSIGLEVISIDMSSSLNEIEQLKSASVVIFSVPMHLLKDAVETYKQYIPKNALVVENCSVKNIALSTLTEKFKETNEVLGIHTMFGPSIESLKRENVIITKTEYSGAISEEFEQIFYKGGAILHHGSVEEHDKCVSILQGLVQYSTLVLGNSLLKEIDKFDQLKPYLTPNSRSVLSSLERLLNQSPDLLFDIQAQNPNTLNLREEFSRSSENMSKILTNRSEFLDFLSKLGQLLGPKLDTLK